MSPEQARELVSSLFESWYSTLIRYANRNTGRNEGARDAVQQTFMALYEALIKGQEIRSPKAWTLCVLRREIRSLQDEAADYAPLETFDENKRGICVSFLNAESDEVLRALNVLTAREQEALLLRIEALRYREIAEAMGVTTSTVNVLLSRAVAKLREVFVKTDTVRPAERKSRRNGSKAL